MKSVEVICSLALLAAVVFADRTPTTAPPPPRCQPGLAVNCIVPHVDLVWSKNENNECVPVLNRCWYDQTNCARYRKGLPLLQEIPQAECQTMCVNDCSNAQNVTICAHRDERYCTFPSQCEWSKRLCNTGEYYFQEGPQPCGPNPEPCFA